MAGPENTAGQDRVPTVMEQIETLQRESRHAHDRCNDLERVARNFLNFFVRTYGNHPELHEMIQVLEGPKAVDMPKMARDIR